MKKAIALVLSVLIVSSLFVGCGAKKTNNTTSNNVNAEKKQEEKKFEIITGTNSLGTTPEKEMTKFNLSWSLKNGGTFYQNLKASQVDYIDKSREMYNLNVDNFIKIYGTRSVDAKEAYDATVSIKSPYQEPKMAFSAALALTYFCGGLQTEETLNVLEKLGFDRNATTYPSKEAEVTIKGYYFKSKVDKENDEISITLLKQGDSSDKGFKIVQVSKEDMEKLDELKYLQSSNPEQDKAMKAIEKNEEGIDASMKIVSSGDKYTVRISPISKDVIAFLASETSADVNYNNVTEKELGDINSNANKINELLSKEKLPKRLVVTFMPYSCNEQEGGYFYKRRYKDIYEILLFNNSTSLVEQFKTQFEKYKGETKE